MAGTAIVAGTPMLVARAATKDRTRSHSASESKMASKVPHEESTSATMPQRSTLTLILDQRQFPDKLTTAMLSKAKETTVFMATLKTEEFWESSRLRRLTAEPRAPLRSMRSTSRKIALTKVLC